jgi:hypothetical protein
MGISFVVVVIIAVVYVARRSRHPRAIGAFRNRPTGSSAAPMHFAGSGDSDGHHDDLGHGEHGADDSSSVDSGDAGASDGGGGDGGGSDGGGGDGGGGGE